MPPDPGAPAPAPIAPPVERTRAEARAERDRYEARQAEEAWRLAQRAPTQAAALPWLERAHRFASADRNVRLTLAGARLATGAPDAARPLFAELAAEGTREAWLGLAACALILGEPEAARAALQEALAGFAAVPATLDLVRRLAGDTGLAWCALDAGFTLTLSHPAPVTRCVLDGVPLETPPSPAALATGAVLEVRRDGEHVLGSPIDLRLRRRVEGAVALTADGLAGWAWYPRMPEADPRLSVTSGAAVHGVVADDLSAPTDGGRALAIPRGFRLAVPTRDRVWHVRDADGRDLLGSPLGGPAVIPPAAPAADTARTVVVVPVHGDVAGTAACLDSVLATIGKRDRVVAVADAPPDPAMPAMLAARAAADPRLAVIPAASTCLAVGFVRAANRGLAAAAGCDAVLLNSDTLVFPGWLRRLRRAVRAAPDIASATPLSNDASVFSFPDPDKPAPMPPAAAAARLSALAARVNAGQVVEAPTGHGFCLYLRAGALAAIGLLREDLFAQGYGEENDWTERARARGWRHVAVPSVYVAHRGGTSFGEARRHLLARNIALLARTHPGYLPAVAAFRAADPLRPAREALTRAVLAEDLPAGPKVLIVTHDGPGGTARVTDGRAAAARAAGEVPLLLRGADGAALLSAPGTELPEARFDLPREAAALRALLRRAGVARAELHHPAGHDGAALDLPRALGVPYAMWVHDWGWFCPRLSLVTGEGRYCGEPPPAACDACVAAHGSALHAPIPAARLRARSARLMAGADAIWVATEDAARRMRRHFPRATVRVTAWEAPLAAPSSPRQPALKPVLAQPAHGAMLTVAVCGAIGIEKGHEVLLACARDALARRLPLRFHVVGYTADDDDLLRTGQVFVTGRFAPDEAGDLLRRSGATIGFLPAIWPETWCFALTDLWRAGLPVAVFDIGAPAERVRAAGRGWVLPLGLPAARVNDALLSFAARGVRGLVESSYPCV